MNTQEIATPAPAESQEAPVRPYFRSQEDEDGATLLVAIPGVKKDDLKLTLHESNLKIEADRSDVLPEGWRTHRDTAASRRYALNVHLTSRFDGTNTTASLEDGILTLRVPVREEAKPRHIAVA
jgi:HSP20 family molecular chaperone IbpA